MFILYDLIFLIIVLIHLPLYILRGKYRHGLLERAGIRCPRTSCGPIWLHAVSVGEAVMLKPLAQRIRQRAAGRQFVISTVTATGNKIAGTMAGGADLVTYLPFDLSFIVCRVMDRLRPSLFICAETEIWPNLIRCLYKRKVPIIVVNARISDRSFRGYSLAGFLIKPLLGKITFFCAQTMTDRSRLEKLGVSPENIKVTGNMKFDSANISVGAEALIRCRRALSLGDLDKLWVCGSTHPGEEEQILKVYGALLKDFPALKLLIAPRHPERAAEIEKLIARQGFRPVRISLFDLRAQTSELRPVFILDTVGELVDYYAVSDIVFMGGSLVKKGGHNFLEPAMLEKPVLTGPHTFNFSDLAELFLSHDALSLVKDPDGLEQAVRLLLTDRDRALSQARAGRSLIIENQGAVERTLACLENLLLTSVDGSAT